MKRVIPYIIVVVGSIGILLNFFNVEFLETKGSNFDSLVLFKYFTIQSNIIVVLYFSMLLWTKSHQKSMIFRNYIGAVTLCITMTFSMFFLFLEPIWNPQGIHLISSTILHYINPFLVIVFFVISMKDYSFRYKDIAIWVIYPILYLIFVLIFGAITGDYIYPFLNINELGILTFVLTILILLLGYLGLSFLIVKIVSQNNGGKI